MKFVFFFNFFLVIKIESNTAGIMSPTDIFRGSKAVYDDDTVKRNTVIRKVDGY